MFNNFKNLNFRQRLNVVGLVFFSAVILSIFFTTTLGFIYFFIINGLKIGDLSNVDILFRLLLETIYLCSYFIFFGIPLMIWSMRAGKQKFIIYGGILWLLIVLFIIFSTSFNKNNNALFGVWPFLAGAGLVCIGFIPSKNFRK